MANMIVFDIETKHTFDEVGGMEFREKLGVSYVGVYSYSQQQYFGFVEEDLPHLEKILLEEKPTMIGFNSIHFDNAVLQPYFKNLDLSQLPQLDILLDIERALGHRLKLDSVAGTTLFAQKSGDGLDAVRWYRQGDMESLAKYCIDDVAITKDVYEFGLRHGVLYYTTGGQKTAVPISWAQSPTIPEMVAEAFKKHVQLHITYINVINPGTEQQIVEKTKYTVDILSSPEKDVVDAFIHETQSKQPLHVSQIWEAEITEEASVHQVAMF